MRRPPHGPSYPRGPAPIAGWTCGLGANDYRHELAGLADPFLGHPAPALSVFVGIVLSLLAVVAMAIIGRVRPSPEDARRGVR